MSYQINFSTATASSLVKDTVAQRWGLDPQTVYAGTEIDWDSYSGPQLVALVQTGLRPGSDFDTEFSAGEVFAEVCGHLSELELATILCRALGSRAIIDDGGRADDCWMLVTEDGWHGRVILDEAAAEENDAMVVAHAYQPIPLAPEIPVHEPPSWQGGWYDGGRIPESGFLEVTE